jgi:hypothetical protein
MAVEFKNGIFTVGRVHWSGPWASRTTVLSIVMGELLGSLMPSDDGWWLSLRLQGWYQSLRHLFPRGLHHHEQTRSSQQVQSGRSSYVVEMGNPFSKEPRTWYMYFFKIVHCLSVLWWQLGRIILSSWEPSMSTFSVATWKAKVRNQSRPLALSGELCM